ncbi:unnamed protein product, partial [Scytosiphon promiscuus]
AGRPLSSCRFATSGSVALEAVRLQLFTGRVLSDSSVCSRLLPHSQRGNGRVSTRQIHSLFDSLLPMAFSFGQTAAPAPSTSLFGAPAAAPSTSLFGAPAATTTGGFGGFGLGS